MSISTIAHRPLGTTGLHVSALGLGTVKIGRNLGVKYPTDFELPSDSEVIQLLDTARELGINLLDTAPAYGNSEERLGKLLRHREHWVLCSKVGEEFENGQSRFDFSAAHTRQSVERSLRRLRTDWLDLVLVHSDGNDEHIINETDCLPTLHDLKQEGLIRAFGLSGKTVTGGLLALKHSDVVMVTHNLGYTDELPVIREAHRRGKGVLIKKALNSGHAVTSDNPVRDSLQFCLEEPGVSSIIVGTINPDHLRANVQAITDHPE